MTTPATSAEIIATEERWQIPTYAHIPVALVRGMGLEPIELDTSEFLKSGGSVFCMKLMVP